jgi:glycosyltransferase involved in cell wall biosynthesis
MTVYNQKPEYLRLAIESILGQTFKNFEFIIVDDGSSSKECSDMIERYAQEDPRIVRIRNKKNLGLTKSLNKAIKIARSPYIARMDSDDISLPDRLKEQIAFLDKKRDYVLVGGWAEIIDESGSTIGGIRPETEYGALRKTALKRNHFIHPTWMLRKSLVDKVGPYDERAVGTEDYDFILRIARKQRIANLPRTLLKYRFNTNGLSFGKNKLQEKQSLILRWRALREYGYPQWQIVYLFQPLLLYLFIPSWLKRLLLKFFFKHA